MKRILTLDTSKVILRHLKVDDVTAAGDTETGKGWGHGKYEGAVDGRGDERSEVSGYGQQWRVGIDLEGKSAEWPSNMKPGNFGLFKLILEESQTWPKPHQTHSNLSYFNRLA